MKPVALMDAGFLLVERRNQPMHVGALMLVRPPVPAAEFIEQVKEKCLQQIQAQPPFNQKLVRHLGAWFWTEDEDFDLESHFQQLSLPRPGRIRELLALVSKLHGNLMDRTKPLWEVTLIDGLDDGRIAVYNKVHHALMDGITAMRLMQRATTESAAEETTAFWALPPKPRSSSGIANSPVASMVQAAEVARRQAISVPTVAREVWKSIQARRTDPDHVSVFQAPRTIFNQRVSGSRRFAAQSFSLARMKAAGKLHGATLNDVVLAMCGSALRRYLMDLDALPDKPLVAMVPISLRKDDSEGGNQVAMALASLATQIADPVERLQTVMRSMNDSKQRFARMSQNEILAYLGVVMAAHGVNFALGINPRWQAFNIVVSNVPGPKEVRYWNGGRVVGMYPLSIVMDGTALNITLNSYAGNLEVGLIACRRVLPHMQKLLHYLEAGLMELELEPGSASNDPA
jgi:diacylglycerol O-acyltransferase